MTQCWNFRLICFFGRFLACKQDNKSNQATQKMNGFHPLVNKTNKKQSLCRKFWFQGEAHVHIFCVDAAWWFIWFWCIAGCHIFNYAYENIATETVLPNDRIWPVGSGLNFCTCQSVQLTCGGHHCTCIGHHCKWPGPSDWGLPHTAEARF